MLTWNNIAKFLLACHAPKVSKYIAFISRTDHKVFEFTVILFQQPAMLVVEQASSQGSREFSTCVLWVVTSRVAFEPMGKREKDEFCCGYLFSIWSTFPVKFKDVVSRGRNAIYVQTFKAKMNFVVATFFPSEVLFQSSSRMLYVEKVRIYREAEIYCLVRFMSFVGGL